MANKTDKSNPKIRQQFNSPIVSGLVKLVFIAKHHLYSCGRQLIAGFEIDNDPAKRMVFVSPREALSFQQFQRRILETAGVFIDHIASEGTPAAKKTWHNEVHQAIKAGEAFDLMGSDFRLCGSLI